MKWEEGVGASRFLLNSPSFCVHAFFLGVIAAVAAAAAAFVCVSVCASALQVETLAEARRTKQVYEAQGEAEGIKVSGTSNSTARARCVIPTSVQPPPPPPPPLLLTHGFDSALCLLRPCAFCPFVLYLLPCVICLPCAAARRLVLPRHSPSRLLVRRARLPCLRVQRRFQSTTSRQRHPSFSTPCQRSALHVCKHTMQTEA